MVVRGLVRRVVRGVVRRVVRGLGSVGSPRSGGQFFQLSQLKQSQLRHLCSLTIIYLTFSLAVVKFTLVLIGPVITFFWFGFTTLHHQSGILRTLATESKFMKRELCA